jgi:hypothetical protein
VFTARRVPDGDLAEAAHQLDGSEFVASVNRKAIDLKAEGRLYLPPKLARARVVVVVLRWGNGSFVYDQGTWRRFAAASGVALLRLDLSNIRTPTNFRPDQWSTDGQRELLMVMLRTLATESGHRELVEAPLFFWGHSAAAELAASLAGVFPDRAVAVVCYQGFPLQRESRGPSQLRRIPMLFLLQRGAGAVVAEIIFKEGRSTGAPWTFAVDPDSSNHGAETAFAKSTPFMISWMTAVLGQRLPSDRTTLRGITAVTTEQDWFPDESTARAWRDLSGQ